MKPEKVEIDIINIMIVERKTRKVEIKRSIEMIEIEKIENNVEEDFQPGYANLSPHIEENNKINEQIKVLRKEERDLSAEISNLEIMGSM